MVHSRNHKGVGIAITKKPSLIFLKQQWGSIGYNKMDKPWYQPENAFKSYYENCSKTLIKIQ